MLTRSACHPNSVEFATVTDRNELESGYQKEFQYMYDSKILGFERTKITAVSIAKGLPSTRKEFPKNCEHIRMSKFP